MQAEIVEIPPKNGGIRQGVATMQEDPPENGVTVRHPIDSESPHFGGLEEPMQISPLKRGDLEIELQEPLIWGDVQVQDLRQLAAAVVLQALEDAKYAAHIERRLEALLWLTGPDVGLWFEWSGLRFADPYSILISGMARQSQTRRRTGHGRKG